jgi:hypothetical protein
MITDHITLLPGLGLGLSSSLSCLISHLTLVELKVLTRLVPRYSTSSLGISSWEILLAPIESRQVTELSGSWLLGY